MKTNSFFVIFSFILLFGAFGCQTPEPLSQEELTSYPAGFEAEFKKNFMGLTYINLDEGERSTKRRAEIEENFSSDFWNLERFKGVYGPAIEYKRMKPLIAQKITTPEGRELSYKGEIFGGLSKGELGVQISHFLVWEKIASDPNEDHIYFVAEDDMDPVDFFKERFLSALYHAPKDWELLYLFSFQNHFWGCHYGPLELTSSKRFLILDKKCTPGMVSYLIRPKGARALLEGALPFQDTVDQRVGRKFIQTGKLKIYSLYPEIIKHIPFEDSVIKDMGGRVVDYFN